MKFTLILMISSLAVLSKCTKEKSTVPPCIQQKIEAIKAQPKWNPPAEVIEYVYNGKTVYGFSNDCCDQYYEVFDADCKMICAPSGGITGKGDGQCADFLEKATKVRVIYKDSR